MTRRITGPLLIALLCLGLAGCGNIFDALYPDQDSTTTNTDDLVALGDSALQSGQVDSALDYYGRAVAQQSGNSRARRGYTRAYIMKKNADLLYLASGLSGQSTNIPHIITDSAVSMTNTMNVVIDKLLPVSQGSCDGIVPATDFEINMNLALAYFLRAFLRNGDSNGDGSYFSASGPGGGDLFIFQNGNITYNVNVSAFTVMQGPLENLLDQLNGFGTSGILPRSSVSNVLVLSHDITEDILFVYRVFGSSFDDFLGAASALNQAVGGLSAGSVMDDIRTEINQRVAEMSGYFNGATADANNLSSDHLRVVGTQMSNWNSGASGWYSSFVKSGWTNHLTGIPVTVYAAGKTNLLHRFSTHPASYTNTSPYDILYITDVAEAVNNILQHVQNANLLNSIGGGS